MKINIFIIVIFIPIVVGCSANPTVERFENIIKRHIGKNISETGGKGEYYKVEQKDKVRWYYSKNYNYRTKGECIYVFITDLNDIILKYRILTPETCKAGIPISG